MRIELPKCKALPDGGWAVLREPEDLTNRHRKLLRAISMPAFRLAGKLDGLEGKTGDALDAEAIDVMSKVSAGDLDSLSDMQAGYIIVYLESWSWDRPLPTIDDVDDLPMPIFDALAEATTRAGSGEVDLSPDGAVDPKSPTVPSPA